MSGQESAIMQVVRNTGRALAIQLGLDPAVELAKWDSGTVHTVATDRSLVTTRHQIGVIGTFTSLKIRIESGAPDRNVYIEVTIEDNQQRVQSKVMQGYVDVGSEPFGNGDLPVKKDWFIAINSWSSVAASLTLRGTLEQGKVETGGWTGTDEDRTSGQGNIRTITGSDPAAGAEFSEAIATNSRLKLRAIKVTFVTDATSATREVTVTNSDGATVFSEQLPVTTHVASTTRVYTWARGGHSQIPAVSQIITTNFPDYILDQAYVTASLTKSIKAGDDFAAPLLHGEEFLVE